MNETERQLWTLLLAGEMTRVGNQDHNALTRAIESATTKIQALRAVPKAMLSPAAREFADAFQARGLAVVPAENPGPTAA